MKSFIALTVAAFTLASCGGGATSTALTSTTRNVGILPSGFAATYDDATDEVVLTFGGVEMARLGLAGIGTTFTTYEDGNTSALYAVTISGDGAVFVVSDPSVDFDFDLAGVHVARLGETVLPIRGFATFVGQYGGVFVDTDLVLTGSIRGDAELTADFTSASISGEITNRSGTGFTADDIVLLPTAITSAGAFSGTTTGGDLVGVTTALTGEYVGLIVGATGNEGVGGLNLRHLAAAGTLIEIGAFVTSVVALP